MGICLGVPAIQSDLDHYKREQSHLQEEIEKLKKEIAQTTTEFRHSNGEITHKLDGWLTLSERTELERVEREAIHEKEISATLRDASSLNDEIKRLEIDFRRYKRDNNAILVALETHGVNKVKNQPEVKKKASFNAAVTTAVAANKMTHHHSTSQLQPHHHHHHHHNGKSDPSRPRSSEDLTALSVGVLTQPEEAAHTTSAHTTSATPFDKISDRRSRSPVQGQPAAPPSPPLPVTAAAPPKPIRDYGTSAQTANASASASAFNPANSTGILTRSPSPSPSNSSMPSTAFFREPPAAASNFVTTTTTSTTSYSSNSADSSPPTEISSPPPPRLQPAAIPAARAPAFQGIAAHALAQAHANNNGNVNGNGSLQVTSSSMKVTRSGNDSYQRMEFTVTMGADGLGFVLVKLSAAEEAAFRAGYSKADPSLVRMLVKEFREIADGNPVVKAGMQLGDILEEVNGQSAGTVAALLKSLQRAKQSVSLTVYRKV